MHDISPDRGPPFDLIAWQLVVLAAGYSTGCSISIWMHSYRLLGWSSIQNHLTHFFASLKVQLTPYRFVSKNYQTQVTQIILSVYFDNSSITLTSTTAHSSTHTDVYFFFWKQLKPLVDFFGNLPRAFGSWNFYFRENFFFLQNCTRSRHRLRQLSAPCGQTASFKFRLSPVDDSLQKNKSWTPTLTTFFFVSFRSRTRTIVQQPHNTRLLGSTGLTRVVDYPLLCSFLALRLHEEHSTYGSSWPLSI